MAELTEQQALADILGSQASGGGVNDAGLLGAGADVPAVLESDPAIRQLLEEAIFTRTGQVDKAIASSAEFNAPTTGFEDQLDTGFTDGGEFEADLDAGISDLDTLISTQDPSVTDISTGTITAPELTDAEGIFGEQDLQIGLARNLNADQLAAQISAINSEFVNRKLEQRALNKNRLGATRNLLAATGASTFASGQGAITSELQRGQDALAQLSALEQQAIRAAKLAAAGQDIALLQKSINNAEAARTAANEVRQQTFENLLALRADDRDFQETIKNDAQNALNAIGLLSAEEFANIDQGRLLEIQSTLGLPLGYFDALRRTVLASQEAAGEEASFARQKELFEMALQLPAGLAIPFGDGTIIGLDVGDHNIFQFTDNAGNVSFVTVDAFGNPINFQQVPGIDKAQISTGGGGGGGGGSSQTSIPQELADYISRMISQKGEDRVEGDPSQGQWTLDEITQAMLSQPDIIANDEWSGYVIELTGSIGAQGEGTFKLVDIDGVGYLFNEKTGEYSPIEPVAIESGGGVIDFIKGTLKGLID